MDFAMLPPEINSTRMYSGAGSGPMLAAAAAWHGLAADLDSAAASYESLIGQLSNGWLGPASTSMAAAAAPYAAWMHSAAARAEQTATQAQAAAAAYDNAFAMTVPPPVVAANRAQLAALVATNLLGQNTPAIAATEAHYSEMWAQDAAAMYGYAASSAAAATLTPFPAPDPTTNPAGMGNQAAAAAQAAGTATATRAPTAIASIATVPQALQSLTSPASSMTALSTLAPTSAAGPLAAAAPAQAIDPGLALALASLGFSVFGALAVDGFGTFGIDTIGTFGIDVAGVGVALQAAEIDTGGIYPGWGLGGITPAAVTGQANSIGGLSVPQSWVTTAPPAIRQIAMTTPESSAAALIATGESEIPYAEMAAAGLAGRALGATTNLRRREPAGSTTRKRLQPYHTSLGGPVTGIAAELRELADLHNAGILTDEEFTEQKRRLLDQ